MDVDGIRGYSDTSTEMEIGITEHITGEWGSG